MTQRSRQRHLWLYVFDQFAVAGSACHVWLILGYVLPAAA